MLNSDTKRHIDAARDVLVGVAPNPTTQIDQITYALIYKFMDDMDQASVKAGGEASFFVGDLENYAWSNLMSTRMGNQEKMDLYSEALTKFSEANQLPELFRTIFRAAFLPYRSPETLGLFLKEISYFDYTHPEELGNAYEYLLSIMSSQGDAGQFRTPRHIIDFIVDVINPTKDDKVLDPACGTGGFLVSTYNHILEQHDGKDDPKKKEKPLTPDERKKLMSNLQGYDIDPTMVRIAQVNMYLHQFKNPQIFQYDSLTSEDRWNDKYDVILANPPFMTPKGGIKPHNKFSISSSSSEVLFVDYIIKHLRPKGRAAIIVPDGVLYTGISAYKQLRKNLLQDGLYAVVSLPSGVFHPYSGVKTSILFLDTSFENKEKSIIFAEVTNTGISLGAAKKVMSENDFPDITLVMREFRQGKKLENAKKLFVCPIENIEQQLEYNLRASSYSKQFLKLSGKNLVRLGDVCRITKGKSSSTKTIAGPYPLILTAENSKTSESYDFEGNGVAVPLISALGHGKAEVKRIHYIEGKFALANLLAFVEPVKQELLLPKYLYYALDAAKPELARLMKGAANVSMGVGDLSNLEIPLDDYSTQLNVARNLDEIVSLLDAARVIVENWKPKIEPEKDWKVFKLGEVSTLATGGTPLTSKPEYYGGDIKWLVSGDIHKEEIFDCEGRISELGFKESNAKLLPMDSVMIALNGQGKTRGTVSILRTEACCNQSLVAISTNKSILLPEFLLYQLKGMYKEIRDINGDKERGGLNMPILRNIEISIPNLQTQQEIVRKMIGEKEKVDSVKSLIEIYENHKQKALDLIWA